MSVTESPEILELEDSDYKYDPSSYAFVKDLLDEARRAKKPIEEKWSRAYKLLRNRYVMKSNDPRFPDVALPEILPIIATCVGWMTDQRPLLTAKIQIPSGTPYYDYYSKLGLEMTTELSGAWAAYKWGKQVGLSCFDAYTYGAGVFKTNWSTTLAGGLGDVQFRRINPWRFFPDPNASNLEECNYLIELKRMTLTELDRYFPGISDLLKSHDRATGDGFQGSTEPSQSAPLGQQVRFNYGKLSNPNGAYGQTPTSTGSNKFGSQTPGHHTSYKTEDLKTVVECWYREHYFDPDGNLIDGWCVKIMVDNWLLLSEKAVDVWDHGSHPYSHWPLLDNGEFWSISMVELLDSAQRMINRLLASFQRNVELSGDPILVESQTQTGRQSVGNVPGQRITVNGRPEDMMPKWMQPPPIHPAVGELIRFYIAEMGRISGMEAIRGSHPGGRNSEAVMNGIQEAAFVRIRMALQNLEVALSVAGDKMVSLMAEHYTAPRLLRQLGPQSPATVMTSDHFYTVDLPDDRVPMQFMVSIEANSSLAVSREAKIAEADVLFSLGGIDRKALLDAHDYPNRDAVLERMAAMDAAQQSQTPTTRQGTRPPG